MITLQEPAYAKLNLTLDILNKREDGYHEIESIMQQITLRDDIEIDLETGEDWKLECDWEDVPADSENLAWKAAGLFYKTIGKDPQGITIRITKRIQFKLERQNAQLVKHTTSHQDLFDVNVRTAETQGFHAQLVELTITTALGTFVAEHRTEVPQALRSVVAEIVFNHATNDTGRVFRAQSQLLTVQ